MSLNSASSANDSSCASLLTERSVAPIQVFSVNADQVEQVIEHLGDGLRSDSYRIITPFWELSNLPEAWVGAFDRMDEVWAPTRFIQTMLTRKLDKPIFRMPLMLEFVPPTPMARSRFNLPRDRFLFFFAFFFLFAEPVSCHSLPLASSVRWSRPASDKARGLAGGTERDDAVLRKIHPLGGRTVK